MRFLLALLVFLSLPTMAQAPPCRDHACSNDSLTPPVVGDEIGSFTLPTWPDCDGTASTDTTPGVLVRFEVVVLETGQTPEQGRTCYTEYPTSMTTRRRGTFDAWRSYYFLAWLPSTCFPDPGIMTRTVVRLWWSCKGGTPESRAPSNETSNWISWQGQPYAWLDIDPRNGARCERRASVNAPRRFTQFPECS